MDNILKKNGLANSHEMEFIQYKHAELLPVYWDELAESYFQQRKFLSHAEKYNPCQQRYYCCTDNEKPIAAAIVYSIKLDIFTYLRIKSPVKMNIIGVPCSISTSGIFGENNALEVLKNYIFEHEKGLTLALNLTEKPVENTNASGKTLPTIVFYNQFTDWNNFLSLLRSNYRRRLKLINQQNENLRFEKKCCSEFTKEMHRQYLEVYNRSNGKLEKLSFDFFRNLPEEFVLTVCSINEEVIGWNIALYDNKIYYFFLGGINYKLNNSHQTYFRLLSLLIRDGIENKAKIIELGQTAETAKMRMGGKPETLYMEAHHNNKFLNYLLKKFGAFLEYKFKPEKNRVNKLNQIPK